MTENNLFPWKFYFIVLIKINGANDRFLNFLCLFFLTKVLGM